METLDIVVLILYLLLVLGIGWFAGRHRGTVEYFLAGRSMGWLPVGLSIMVTSFSAINYTSIPTEVFGHGLAVTASFLVFFIVAWPISRIWMPYFHGMGLTSVYEFLERRFDWRVRTLASGLFILWRFFWMATALYASAKIMSVITGWSLWVLVLICGVVATAYTFWGGIRAVMWTDVLQFVVLFGGLVYIVYIVFNDDPLETLRLAYESGSLKPFAPFDSSFLSFDPRVRMTLWSALVGVSVTFLARYGADQVVMQRYFTARDLSVCQRGIWLNAAASFVTLGLLSLLGVALSATACRNGLFRVEVWDGLNGVQRQGVALKQMAVFVKGLPFGGCGLVFAGLLAATMSSVDSGINSCATAYVTDFQRRFGWRGVSPRWLVLGVGAVCTGLGMLLIPAMGKSSSLFAIVNKVVNGLGSPLLCLMLLGMFGKGRFSSTGVLVGGVIGLILSLSISLFMKSLALQYYSVANLLATFAACAVCSAFFKKGDWHDTKAQTS